MLYRFSAWLVVMSVFLAGCSTTSAPPANPGDGSGAFKVLATSAPSANLASLAAGDYKAVTLAVSSVVFVSGAETTPLATYSEPVVIDLLSLNSVQAELADSALPAGVYEGAQLRLVVSSASLVVEAEDGSDVTVPLKIPSGEQSGFKINLQNFTVDPVYGASVVLNFDADKSVVKTGNGSYNLKPVVKATTAANARVKLVNAVADASADLSVSANGVALRDVAYGTATSYLLVPAGEVQFAATEVALGNAVTLASEADYTVVVTGLLASVPPLAARVYSDAVDAPGAGSAKLRVVNAAPGLPLLDLYATAADADPVLPLETPLVAGLEYAAASAPYLELPAATYRFRATAGAADVLLDTDGNPAELLEGKTYTVVALGDPSLGAMLELLVSAD